MSKHAVGLDYKIANKLPFSTGQLSSLARERSYITPNIDFNINPRKSSKIKVFASILQRNLVLYCTCYFARFWVKAVIFILVAVPAILPASVQVASRLFTFGTAFVVPFYTVMILAPHASWTRKLVESSFAYGVLGVLYLYLLFLSWSPETLSSMFASKYWLPELPGITRMFSSTLTVASAWLHLLAVDLFAGRQIYLDGLQHSIETRHSLVLCLLFCPVGMLSHFFTKVIVRLFQKSSQEVPDAAKLC